MSKYLCLCSETHSYDSGYSPKVQPVNEDVKRSKKLNAKKNAVLKEELNLFNLDEEVMIDFEPNNLHYEMRTTIGKSCNGAVTVHLSKHLPSGKHVALKRIDLESYPYDLNIIVNEVAVCKQIQHEKILPFYCSFIHKHEVYNVMPMMAYGSCKDLMHAHFHYGFSEQAIAYILRDTLLALDYLHSRGIIHRGVQASHILISGNGSICLSGMRNSYSMFCSGKRKKVVHDYPMHAVDSLQWLSPEILEQNLAGYDTKSDIYSLGIAAIELGHGFAPFADMPPTQMLFEKLNGTKPVLIDSSTIADMRDSLQEDGTVEPGNTVNMMNAMNKQEFAERSFSSQFHTLVDACLERDPINRPSSSQLLSYPFFRNLRRKTEEALPRLLHPVTPITDVTCIPQGATNDDELAQGMQKMELDNDWNF